MADAPYQVDLTTCDLEPIHIIGRIQSFGYLLSCSSDWIVNHVSENCADLFATPLADLIGVPATNFIAPSALHDIRSRLQLLTTPDSVQRLFAVDLKGDGRLFDIAVYGSGRSYVIEFENADDDTRRDYIGYIRPMVERMRQSGSVRQLCEIAARQLRALAGFDRVMVYRFAADGSGEVIAESAAAGIDSFKGQHFPASDIPAQARALYARNILRIISDIDDPTIPVVPATNPSGVALDLSMSGLRAVSPIHIEYLRNMGVRASMSVSIMRRGKLWGMMACHHYEPRHLPYSIRTASELFGEFFSHVLEQIETDQVGERRERAMRLHDEIMSRVAAGEPLLASFEQFAESIGRVIPFDGIVGYVGEDFIAQGVTPDRAQFERIARFLNTAGAGQVWATDKLSRAYPEAAEFADRCAGLLAFPVSRRPRDYIVLFRREHVHTVEWAGNPDKPVELGPNGARLTPRKSFELWREERRGQSLPWEEAEIASAESLRVTLLEVVLRIADQAHLDRELAARRQDTLIAELNHRVRNILNLILGLVSQSRAAADSVAGFAELLGNRIHALARAHDQVTQANWEPSSLATLIRTECAAYVAEKVDRVIVSGTDAMLHPSAYTQLALVVHELTTNSCKYGALSDSRGTVAVQLDRRGDGSLSFAWSERGGPPVRKPERRGFGSTIIERTIPHELEGTADVSYQPAGFEALFVLPPQHIARFADLPASAFEAPPTVVATDKPRIGGEVLIVEDNMIIAMEAEDILSDLGASRCHVSSSSADALAILADRAIAFAMLDINLGNETSSAVAQELKVRGIPFICASGYGDVSDTYAGFERVPVVRKPYANSDIARAVSLAIEGIG